MSQEFSSYSQLTSHRTCAQLWNYRYNLGYQELPGGAPAVELIFGTAWHAVMAGEALDRGRAMRGGPLHHEPEHLTVPGRGGEKDGEMSVPPHDSGMSVLDAVWGYLDTWWRAAPEEYRTAFVEKLGEDAVPRLRYMLETWREHWASELEHEEPLGVEVRWSEPLPPAASPTGKVFTGVSLSGYIDQVYFDRRRGMIGIRDYKTGKALPLVSALDDMMDSQLQLYAWGAFDTIAAWGRGEPQLICYDRVRTVAPKLPQLTKAGKLAKSVTDFDHRTYREWAEAGQEFPGLKADGSGAGTYQFDQAVYDGLATPAARSKWLQRTRVPLNPTLVREHLRAASATALQVNATRALVAAQGSAPRSFGKACGWCSYADLCRAQLFGGPDGTYDLGTYGLRERERNHR